MSQLTLHHFLSLDNLRLPGLLYEPAKQSKAVALFLHGNGSSSVFYSSMTNIMGQTLTSHNISYFAFNNRGALYTKSLKRIDPQTQAEERVTYGSYIERIKECDLDIEGAINYLETQGYNTFYLIGHSTGANKIAVYNYYRPVNRVSKYVLLAGGDDTGLYYNELGEDTYWKAIERSQEEVSQGNGLKTVPQYLFSSPYTYQALLDTLDPDGDYNIFPFYEAFSGERLGKKQLFKELKKIVKPTLTIYGTDDEYCYGNARGCMEIIKKYTARHTNFDYELLEGANHGFDQYQPELAQIISTWLRQ